MASEQRQKIVKKKTGLFVIFGGFGVLALGYALLAKGSTGVAPVLIIGSFVVMSVGILIGWD